MPKVSIFHKGTICIYGILSPTGKIYIGQTWDLYRRYKSGVSKSQRLLYRSYKKHGEENHKLFIIIDFRGAFTQSDLDYWERYYIEVYKVEGYQILNIRGGGGNNGKLSEDTKKIVGEKSKQYHIDNPEWSQTNIRKLIDANKGSKRTEEAKKAISNALKAYSRTEEHCNNLAMAKKGKPSPHKGKHFSKEAADRIRAAAKTRNQKKCPIIQSTMTGEFIKEWGSIKEASEALSIHKATIGGCIRNVPHYKSAGGFTWHYK